MNFTGIADHVSKSLIDTILEARRENDSWKKNAPLVLLINNLGATPGKSLLKIRAYIKVYVCLLFFFHHTSGIEIYSVAKSSIRYLQSLGYAVSRAYVGTFL